MPKVSAVIPTRNRAKYLRWAINSVLSQTYQDFEIVVVDDASDDDTGRVVGGFGDPRIKYFRHTTSQGDGCARNTGIKNCTGDYIGFLDDDDQWLPEKLALQVAVLENSPPRVGGVYTGHFDVQGPEQAITKVSYPSRRGDLSVYALIESCIVTSCVLLRRRCFDDVGLFDETIPYCSDRDLWVRIAKKYHFEYVHAPLVKYLVHPDKLSRDFKRTLNGREMLLRKYRQEWNRYPQAYAERYLALGELYCYAGDLRQGRAAFLKALRLYPYGMRGYAHYGLSLLGASAFVTAKRMVQGLLAPVRARKVNAELRKLGMGGPRRTGWVEPLDQGSGA